MSESTANSPKIPKTVVLIPHVESNLERKETFKVSYPEYNDTLQRRLQRERSIVERIEKNAPARRCRLSYCNICLLVCIVWILLIGGILGFRLYKTMKDELKT
jgi:hypothetical protein